MKLFYHINKLLKVFISKLSDRTFLLRDFSVNVRKKASTFAMLWWQEIQLLTKTPTCLKFNFNFLIFYCWNVTTQSSILGFNIKGYFYWLVRIVTSSQRWIILLVLSSDSSVMVLALSCNDSSSVSGGPSSTCPSAAILILLIVG